MAAPLYLLDTNILVAFIRAGALGQYIEATYQLRHQPTKPGTAKDRSFWMAPTSMRRWRILRSTWNDPETLFGRAK